MKKIEFKCDIDDKEIQPTELSVYSGTIVKLDKDMQAQRGMFEWHFCGDCTPKIINFVESLKPNAEDTSKK